MKYCVYIIYSIKLDKFYIGETSDFKNRLEEHKTGFYKNSFTAKALTKVGAFFVCSLPLLNLQSF